MRWFKRPRVFLTTSRTLLVPPSEFGSARSGPVCFNISTPKADDDQGSSKQLDDQEALGKTIAAEQCETDKDGAAVSVTKLPSAPVELFHAEGLREAHQAETMVKRLTSPFRKLQRNARCQRGSMSESIVTCSNGVEKTKTMKEIPPILVSTCLGASGLMPQAPAFQTVHCPWRRWCRGRFPRAPTLADLATTGYSVARFAAMNLLVTRSAIPATTSMSTADVARRRHRMKILWHGFADCRGVKNS